jgi:hypothetical protein
MFHAISAGLARLVQRINARLAIPFEDAALHGWQVTKVSRWTYSFRDPRFDQLAAVRVARALTPQSSSTWAQDALAQRIRVLGASDRSGTGSGRDA